jgi:hypothetical protein
VRTGVLPISPVVSSAPSPRLASGTRIASATGQRGGDLAAATGVIRTGAPRPSRLSEASRNLAGLTLLAALAATLIYLALALTVLVVMRIDGSTVLVQRGAFPIGQAPTGTFMFTSSAPADASLAGRATQAAVGVPDAAVVQVLAAPNSILGSSPDGTLTVNGAVTSHPATDHTGRLGREYLARCVLGACTPGQTLRVPQRHVIGAATGTLGPTGRTAFSEPTQ